MSTLSNKKPIIKKNRTFNAALSKKSEATREIILSAARRVFAMHTYNSASLRMIAKEGGFDHAIIRYHFPNKAILFETILIDACNTFYNANLACLKGLKDVNPTKGFSLYIDRVINHSFKIQDILKLFIQNITHIDTPEAIPGYQHIPDTIEKIRLSFEEKIPIRASNEQVGMFVYSFINLLMNYFGANNCMSRILDLDHGGEQYRKWVKESLMFLFLPSLKKLIFPDDYPVKSES